MLSTEVRKKAEYICNRIANGAEVQVSDMIWIQKWAKSNHSVDSMLRRARREALRGEQPAGGLDQFLDDMDIGDPDPTDHLIGPPELCRYHWVGPQDPTSIAEWFTSKRKWFVDDEGFRD